MFSAFLYHIVSPNAQAQKWQPFVTDTSSRLTALLLHPRVITNQKRWNKKIVGQQDRENKMFLCHCYDIVSRTVLNTVSFQSIVSLINIQWYWWTALQLLTSSTWVNSLHAWHKNVFSSKKKKTKTKKKKIYAVFHQPKFWTCWETFGSFLLKAKINRILVILFMLRGHKFLKSMVKITHNLESKPSYLDAYVKIYEHKVHTFVVFLWITYLPGCHFQSNSIISVHIFFFFFF